MAGYVDQRRSSIFLEFYSTAEGSRADEILVAYAKSKGVHPTKLVNPNEKPGKEVIDESRMSDEDRIVAYIKKIFQFDKSVAQTQENRQGLKAKAHNISEQLQNPKGKGKAIFRDISYNASDLSKIKRLDVLYEKMEAQQRKTLQELAITLTALWTAYQVAQEKKPPFELDSSKSAGAGA